MKKKSLKFRSAVTQPRQPPTVGARRAGEGGEVAIASRRYPLIETDAAIGARLGVTEGHGLGWGSPQGGKGLDRLL